MSDWLTDNVIGGLICGNATKGEQQKAYKGIEELETRIAWLEAERKRLESLVQDLLVERNKSVSWAQYQEALSWINKLQAQAALQSNEAKS